MIHEGWGCFYLGGSSVEHSQNISKNTATVSGRITTQVKRGIQYFYQNHLQFKQEVERVKQQFRILEEKLSVSL